MSSASSFYQKNYPSPKNSFLTYFLLELLCFLKTFWFLQPDISRKKDLKYNALHIHQNQTTIKDPQDDKYSFKLQEQSISQKVTSIIVCSDMKGYSVCIFCISLEIYIVKTVWKIQFGPTPKKQIPETNLFLGI